MPPERLSAEAAGIARAAELVKRGEVIAFPTDTVYGLMALPNAGERIFEIKRRPPDKQLIAMAASLESLRPLVSMPPRAEAYARRHWPGPLTLVLRRSDEGGTLGVRVPDHPVALALLRAIGQPVLTTSANLSGEPPAMAAEDVTLEGLAAVVDGGRAPGGTPSTVVNLTGEEPRLIRPGPVTL
jgi:L-threonylcarbamoyladenylate synthase